VPLAGLGRLAGWQAKPRIRALRLGTLDARAATTAPPQLLAWMGVFCRGGMMDPIAYRNAYHILYLYMCVGIVRSTLSSFSRPLSFPALCGADEVWIRSWCGDSNCL